MLETRINEDTGKISIFKITSSKSDSDANMCVTIENIEDETDFRQYALQHFSNIPVYNRVYNDDAQREKEREYIKKNKSNSLGMSLASISRKYPETEPIYEDGIQKGCKSNGDIVEELVR